MPLSPRPIELTLRDIDELFVAHELDPFTGKYLAVSGIEPLVSKLQP